MSRLGDCRLSLTALCLMLGVTLLSACAAPQGGGSLSPGAASPGRAAAANRISVCKTGDTEIASESQCLQDDASCYAIAGGRWCTGPRGNACPTGSVQLPAGTPCPANARCFAVGESLNCSVSY